MPEAWQVCIAAIGAVLALGLIVSLTLAHHIGGFFRTVEREAQEEAKRREDELAAKPSGDAKHGQEI